MKVEVTKEKQQPTEPKFPVLMKGNGDGCIVLFFSRTDGVQLSPGKRKTPAEEPTVHYDNCWAFDCFKPFTGTVTLSND